MMSLLRSPSAPGSPGRHRRWSRRWSAWWFLGAVLALVPGAAAVCSGDGLLSEEMRTVFGVGEYDKVVSLGAASCRTLALQSSEDPAVRRFGLRVSAVDACAAETGQLLHNWAARPAAGALPDLKVDRALAELYRKYGPYRDALQGGATQLSQDAVDFLACMQAAFRRQDDRGLFDMRKQVLAGVPEAVYDRVIATYLRSTRSADEMDADRQALADGPEAALVRRAQFENAFLETEEALTQAAQLTEQKRFEEARLVGRRALVDSVRARAVCQAEEGERRPEHTSCMVKLLEGMLASFLGEVEGSPAEVGFFRFRFWAATALPEELSDFASTAVAREYYRRGDYEKARGEVADLLKAHPKSELLPRVMVLEALVDVRTDRLSEATERLEATLPSAGSDPDAASSGRFLLGYCRLLQGRKEEAAAAFHELIASYPSTEQAARAKELLSRLLPAGAAKE